jgi:hypothetical protein
MTHIPTIGSRIQVYRGHAKKTSGGLTRSDLMMNKHGRVVSKAKHLTAKKEMRLLKHGYGTKKGKFGYVKIGKGKKSRSRKMRGGNVNYKMSPLDLNESAGAGITDFGSGSTDVQLRAGMAGGSGMKPMLNQGSANWSGDNSDGTGMTDFGNSSVGVQIEAGMAGGRRRRRTRSRSMAQRMALSKSRSRGFALRSKGVAMRGGTTSLRSQFVPAELSSVDVQMRAGLGN